MSLFSTLKCNSKLALRDNWGRGMLALLIVTGISALLLIMHQVAFHLFVLRPLQSSPTMEPANYSQILESVAAVAPIEAVLLLVFTLLSIFLTAPIQMGVFYWFWMLVQGKSLPLGTVFCFFDTGKQYFRMVWYYVSVGLRSFFWAILFYTPPVLVCGFSCWFLRGMGEELPRTTVALATAGLMLSLILLVLATVLYLAYMNKYAVAHLLLFDDPELTVGKAVRLSVRYTKGYRFSLFFFALSFVGWALLVPLTLGLMLLFVGPYVNTAQTMYGRYIIEKNRYIPPDSTKEFVVEAVEGFSSAGDEN